MKNIYLTKNFSQTKKLGELLAKKLLRERSKKRSGLRKGALFLGLEGDLGGGKTTFLQGFARGLKIKEKIFSPTFLIIRKFPISKFKTFYHIDCYRIKKPKEILDLGFKKIISEPGNIVAVEWVEKIKKFLPKNIIWINFKFIDKNTRRIIINYNKREKD